MGEESDEGETRGEEACNACRAALPADKKQKIWSACQELHGSGPSHETARRACVSREVHNECKEDCTLERGNLLQESDAADDSDNLEDEDEDEDKDEDEDEDDTDEDGEADGEAEDGEAERAVSGGGSRKACRTCRKALTKDKKKEMRNFCSEISGK